MGNLDSPDREDFQDPRDFQDSRVSLVNQGWTDSMDFRVVLGLRD
jgi:hypothetical protein